MRFFKLLCHAWVALAALSSFSVATAQSASSYPDKPIRLIVPFAPGGNTDVVARVVAEGLGQRLKQSIVVENRAGAAGIVGTEYAARAAADGYTLLVGHIGALTINPYIYSSLPYDTLKDFVPISLSAKTALILCAAPKMGFKTVSDLIAAGKKNPGSLAFSTAGVGSAAYMASILFNNQTGISALDVPYKGATPATTAVVSGEVSFTFGGLAPSRGLVESGRLNALAVTSMERSPLFPDVPTMAEAGVPDFEIEDWNGILAPKGTPPAIIEKLNKAMVALLNDPATMNKLVSLGFTPAPTTPDEFSEFIRSEMKKWAAIAKSANVKVN
ncbi:tripartite tricarboxylate transporter substrate binding protein [Pusillimonas sp. ANT_WB101]|uniref:Bug family tripartite tricarboxylate transporter substrate binding protein n=1 Tax=Pusillimonas sp. ANT_WB101 TaxID=2597356 RepID=UPI00165D30CB|nr:tripartite tricarboxylate transporter substrate binding protein [Pusillimonas sp. ANT_WB101]